MMILSRIKLMEGKDKAVIGRSILLDILIQSTKKFW